jgi:outer membrane autotransporter protein
VGGDGVLAALGAGGPILAYGPDATQAYAANLPVKAPLPAAVSLSDYTVWGAAFGAWGKIDGNGNAAEAKRELGGVVAGFDKRFGNWRLGAAGGYTTSDIRVSARASGADVDSFHVAGYAGGSFGALNVRLGAAFARHEIDTSRTAAFPGFIDQLRAQYDGYTAQLFGEAGYAKSFGRFAVEPFAGLAAVSVHTDSFTETGAAAALAGAGATHGVVYSTLGIRAATTIALSHDKILVPRASVAWQHAFNEMTATTRMTFVNTGTAFAVTGLPIAQDSALVEAGADLAIGWNTTLGLSYVGQLASDAQDHAVKARGTVRF